MRKYYRDHFDSVEYYYQPGNGVLTEAEAEQICAITGKYFDQLDIRPATNEEINEHFADIAADNAMDDE